MNKLDLKAEKRTLLGRKVKSLRKKDIIPANIYGKKIKSLAIQISLNDFKKIYEEAGETNLINLKVDEDDKVKPVLVSNLQLDPVTDNPIHVDFHQVDLTQKVTVAVPVEIIGEASAVKEKGAVLITLLDEIKIEALPSDLPDKFTVNIETLKEFDDSISIKDLKIDKNKITVLAEEDEAIIMVQEPKKEEEPAPVSTETDTQTGETEKTEGDSDSEKGEEDKSSKQEE